MQKKIIALAVAGLMSGAAFAQSNVTIYGAVDATFENVKANGATAGNASDFASRNRVQANSNFIGFKGVEDLGGGLKAVWQFENGLNADNGAAGAWNNRDSYIGLASNYGTLVLGNVTGPTRAMGAKMDINTAATGIGANTALLGKLGGTMGENGAGAFDQRINNAIAYISPNFSGFTGVIGYSAGNLANGLLGREASAADGADGLNGNTAWTLGVNYDNGPFYVAYAYTEVNATNSGAAAADGLIVGVEKAKNHRLAGMYKFGNMGHVGLLWDKTIADLGAAGAGSLKQSVWYLSGRFNVTPNGGIIGQYGHAGDVSGNGALDQSAKHWMIGYEHSLSKRTLVKVGYSKISNDNDASYDFLYGVSAPATTAAGAGMTTGTSVSGWFAGLRHTF